MENKRINVVWCDDKIDELLSDGRHTLTHNCFLYQKARNSDELEKILNEKRDYIDAVIVDFNVGRSVTELLNNESESIKGFHWIHEHYKDYEPIPFFLYSGKDFDFIKEKYESEIRETSIYEDYFFSKKTKRHFQRGEFETLLERIEEDVSNICTREYKIRQEYYEAFEIINKFDIESEGATLIKIMLLDENSDRYTLTNYINALRSVIEKMVAKLDGDGIIPPSKLNDVPKLFHYGKLKNDPLLYDYDTEYLMKRPLFEAFEFYLRCTQDGSHGFDTKMAFREYIQSKKDVYFLKVLAIICFDIIRWMDSFYDKYIQTKPYKFDGYTGIVEKCDDKGYYIVTCNNGHKFYNGKTIAVKPDKNDTRTYDIGTEVKIDSIQPTSSYDYFGFGKQP